MDPWPTWDVVQKLHAACCEVEALGDQYPPCALGRPVEVGHEHSVSAHFDVFQFQVGHRNVIQDGEVGDVIGIDDVDDLVAWPN